MQPLSPPDFDAQYTITESSQMPIPCPPRLPIIEQVGIMVRCLHHWIPIMKKPRLVAGSCALILGFCTSIASADNLIEVYSQALQSDPTFKEAEASWLAAKENVPIALANLLPAMDANAGVNRIYSDLGGANTQANGTQYSLSIGQPLINFASVANWRGAKASTKAAAATYAAAAQNLMFRTAQAYVTVIQADDNLNFTLGQKRAIKEQLINAKQKYEAGITAITGVYQAQASYDAIVATEISDRTTLAENLKNLTAITGKDYATLQGILHQIPLSTPQPNSMEDWVEIARQQNPQIKAQQYTAVAARENIKQQQAGFIPTVTANASYNYASASQQLGAEADKNAAVGATVDFPFYSGGATLAQTRQARYQYVNASAGLEYTYRSTVNQTSQAFLTILAMVSQINADVIAVKSAEASFKATQLGYVAGTQPMLNVLQDLSNVYQARQQYADDQYTYIMAIITLKQAAGTLDYNDLSQINSWLNATKQVARDSSLSLISSATPKLERRKPAVKAQETKTAVAITPPSNSTQRVQGETHYTLQIAAAATQNEAQQFIKQHPELNLQIFTREAKGKIWFSVGYGDYSNSRDAQQALKTITPALAQLKPWVAKVSRSLG